MRVGGQARALQRRFFHLPKLPCRDPIFSETFHQFHQVAEAPWFYEVGGHSCCIRAISVLSRSPLGLLEVTEVRIEACWAPLRHRLVGLLGRGCAIKIATTGAYDRISKYHS